MADNVGNFVGTLELDTRKANQQWKRFQGEINRSTRNNGLGSISRDARQFESALAAATNRVTAFAAAAVVFNTLRSSISAFVKSIVDVEQSLTQINVNLNQTTDGLKKFSSDLFNVARQTGQTFQVTAKAAEELARQGLNAEETTKRLKDALILSRIAGIDSTEAVETLTAAINSFNQSALTSTEVINKFAAVDTQFAVSSKDLAEAVSRVGSTAQGAGVGINELIGLVTSLQQTTARGGSVIGNGLKTIFTRIQGSPETIAALQSVGVSIKDTTGNLRSAIDILRDYSSARKKVGEVERQSLDRTVAGTYQINILKAAMADLSRQNSIYANALNISVNATDEAIRKNAQLNQTLSSLINQTSVSIKQFFASLGEQSLAPVLKDVLNGFEKIRQYLSGDSGDEIGKGLGNGILKGIANVLTGPTFVAITAILGRGFIKIASTLAQEARTLLTINNAAGARAQIQERINFLLANATQAEIAQYRAASSVLAAKEAILRVQQRISAEEISGTSLQNAFLSKGIFGRPKSTLNTKKIPGFADPIASAIKAEMKYGGVPAGSVYVDKDPRVVSSSNPAGLLVANTRDEPLGGFQGVNRVIASGGNPKMGSIPNFAKPLKSSQDLVLESLGLKKINAMGKAPTALSLAMTETSGVMKEFKTLEKNIKLVNKGFETLAKERTASLSHKLALVNKGFDGLHTNLGGGTQYSSPIGPSLPQIIYHTENYSARKQGQNAALKYFQGGSLGQNVPLGVIAAGSVGGNLKITYPDASNSSPANTTQYSGAIGPSYDAFRNYRNYQKGSRMESLAKAIQRGAAKRKIEMANIQQRRDRAFTRAQLVGVGLSFASGFVPEGQSGTGAGMALGAVSGAAQGAGVGGLLGPKGLLIGAAIGGIIGAFSKLSKSIEETTKEINDGIAKRNLETEALDRFIAAQAELNEAKKDGADKEVLTRLAARVEEARGGLTERTAKIAGEANPEKRAEMQSRENAERVRQNAKDELRLALKSSSNITSESLKGTFGADFISNLSPDKIKALGNAARTDFTIPKLEVDRETRSSNILQVAKAQELYKKSLEELSPVLSQIVDISQITPENLGKFAESLQGAILKFQSIEKLTKSTSIGSKGINEKAFLSMPDQQSLALAGAQRNLFSSARLPMSRGDERARIQFEALSSLAQAGGPVVSSQIERSDEYKKNRAGAQVANIKEALFNYLKNAKPGNYRTEGGRLSTSALKYGAQSLKNDQIAQIFLNQLEAAEVTAQEVGYNPSRSIGPGGIEIGTKYTTGGNKRLTNARNLYTEASTFTNQTREQFNEDYNRRLTEARKRDEGKFVTADKNISNTATRPQLTEEEIKRVIDVNVKIDGALNLIAQGVNPQFVAMMQTNLSQEAQKTVQQYFDKIQPGLAEYEARLSKLEGTPRPPVAIQK